MNARVQTLDTIVKGHERNALDVQNLDKGMKNRGNVGKMSSRAKADRG
jgi:hypothetical protein